MTDRDYTPTEGELVLHLDFGVCRIVRDDEGQLTLMDVTGWVWAARYSPRRWDRLVGPITADYQQGDPYKRYAADRRRVLRSYPGLVPMCPNQN
jgi:hypothetical protein